MSSANYHLDNWITGFQCGSDAARDKSEWDSGAPYNEDSSQGFKAGYTTAFCIATTVGLLRMFVEQGNQVDKPAADTPRSADIIESDESAAAAQDRDYWESKTPPEIMSLVDDMLMAIRESIDPTITLKYEKDQIYLTIDGRRSLWVVLSPQTNHLVLSVSLPLLAEYGSLLEDAGIKHTYSKKDESYDIQIRPGISAKARLVLLLLFLEAYNLYVKNAA